jgi:serine protease AprX
MIAARIRVAAVSVLFSAACFGFPEKVSPDLRGLDAASFVDVIIQFDRPLDQSEHARLRGLGGIPKADLELINAAVYTLPAKAIEGLSHNPNIVYMSPDREISAFLDYAYPTVGAQSAVQYGWDGTGVGIAVIDSGVLAHPDLLDKSSPGSNLYRIVYSQSFVPKVTSAADQYGHGMHVAGIIAGNGTASNGSSAFKTFRGIAPNANIINLRVLDSKGAGTDSSVINAINTAIQLKNKYNIRVINLSLGRPVFEPYTADPLCRAVEKAWQAGIVVVVAAGNEGRKTLTNGYATITSPANHPLVITVGAMKTMMSGTAADDQIASYSSKGPTLLDHVVKPDIVAPGNQVISLLASKSTVAASSGATNKILLSYYQNTSNKSYSNDYYRLSGTSMAAPMVSGAVALMLTKDWSLTPETIKARLMKTATKTFPQYSSAVDPVTRNTYTSQYDVFTVGAGYLNIWGALNSADAVFPGGTAASPTAVFDASTNKVTIVNTTSAVWGTTAVWGSTAVWGTAAVWGSSVFVDGLAAVWGSCAVWGSAAVWGTSGTTANAAVWGSTAVWGTGTKPAGETMSLLLNGEN